MFKIKKSFENVTSIICPKATLIFSYEELVMVEINYRTYVTTEKFSSTTARHIKFMLNGATPIYVSRRVLHSLIDITVIPLSSEKLQEIQDNDSQ